MIEFGVITVVGAACFLAWGATEGGSARVIVFTTAGCLAVGYAVLFLAASMLGEEADLGPAPVQIGMLLLCGLAYGLIPAGLLRPFAHRSWAPRAAFILAGLMPFLGLLLFAVFGTANRPVSEGMGNLGDLLFLNPMEMGKGVTRSGFIIHRLQIHYVALGVIVLGAVALQFLPSRPRSGFGESEASSPGDS